MPGDVSSDPQALAALADKLEEHAEELGEAERRLLRQLIDGFMDPLTRASLEADELLDEEEKQVLADLDEDGGGPQKRKLRVLGPRPRTPG